jgi:hypothetical protein
MSDAKKLDGHHRGTVDRLFRHPASHNIQWHDVVSLLQRVGSVTETHKNRYTVTLGEETYTFDATKSRDLSEEQIVDLRRMLTHDGITPETVDKH